MNAEAPFDLGAVQEDMVAAARAALAARNAELHPIAELETRRLAATLADISALAAKGDIDPERAQSLARIHQNTFRGVLRAGEAISLLAAEQALLAVTHVAAAVINRILGFKLL